MNDPVRSSFDLSGTIASIDTDLVRPYLAIGELSCDSLSLELNMRCRDGEFDSNESYIALKMKNTVLTGEFAKKLPPGLNVIPSISIPVPLGGTVSEPELNFAYAFLKTVSDNFQANIVETTKAIVDNLGGDGETTAEALTKLLGGEESNGKGLLEELISDRDAEKAAEALKKFGGDRDTAEELIRGLFGRSPDSTGKRDK
jgi:hypothetical protein